MTHHVRPCPSPRSSAPRWRWIRPGVRGGCGSSNFVTSGSCTFLREDMHWVLCPRSVWIGCCLLRGSSRRRPPVTREPSSLTCRKRVGAPSRALSFLVLSLSKLLPGGHAPGTGLSSTTTLEFQTVPDCAIHDMSSKGSETRSGRSFISIAMFR